ncbi:MULTISPECIES: nucleotidyltransferase family protein [unclassified Thiocapsa]|uniref:nucleotidyltransferase family protein n=1 Tax=unclassified Thiocapsa TaxID=2641286 RepID=UPI0035AF125D
MAVSQRAIAIDGLATAHLVAPSLYATLEARGTLASVPEDVRQALACLHELNDDRNRRLRRVLRETAEILNQADIVPVLLKGAIALLPDQYPLAFARVLCDLDLGVPADQADRAGAALRAFWSDRRSLRQLLEFARLRTLPAAAR